MAPSNNCIWALLAAASAGALISFQILAETALKNTLKGGVFHTSVIAFGSAFAILVMYGLWNGLKIFPALAEFKPLRGFEVFGGLTRILYLILVVFACTRLGIAKATCIVISMQVLASSVFQANALFGSPLIGWTWEKTLGLLLLVLGVVLMVVKRE